MKEIEYDKSNFEKATAEKDMKPHSNIPTVRTFRADVQELIKEKGTTRTDVAMAEAARRETRGEKRFPVEEEGVHLGKIILLLILVLAFSLGVGGYALFGTHLGSFFGSTATSTSPTPTTEDIEVDLTDSPREQVLADISIAFGKTYLPTGGRRTIVFLTKDGDGTLRKATKEEFFSAVSSQAMPPALFLSLDGQFTYQVYSSSTLSGVITLGSRSFSDTFASVLDWEPEMTKMLIPALDPWYDRKNIIGLSERKFKDEQYRGVGMRTLYDLDGDSVLSYAIVNKRTLIIAGKIDGVRSVIDDLLPKGK